MKISLLVLVIIFISALPGLCTSAVDVKRIDSLSTIWDYKLGDAEFTYQHKLIVAPTGKMSMFIAGVYAPVAKKRSRENIEGIWMWEIDNNGKKVRDIRLKNMQDTTEKYVDVEALANIDKDNFIGVIRLNTGQSIIAKFNLNGKVLMTNNIGEGIRISKIIPTADGKLLLIGAQSSDSFLMKIDISGEVLWSKKSDRGKSEMFVDGVGTDEGNFVLIENSGKIEQFFMGTSDVWIAKYDSKGEKLSDKSFSGRYGNIVRGIKGSYAIVYDRSSTVGQDIRVKALDKNLVEMWDVNDMATQFGLERFKSGSLASGDYVVAGLMNLRLNVLSIDSGGSKKWVYSDKSENVNVGIDIVSRNNNCIIVMTAMTLNEKQEINNKIRIIKLQP